MKNLFIILFFLFFYSNNYLFAIDFGSYLAGQSALNKNDNKSAIYYFENAIDLKTIDTEYGKDVAKKLNIQHRNIKLDRNFPMIKCNINKRGKKLFFFPFDKFYDRVHIDIKSGEFYTNSIKECIRKGFKHVG